MKKILLILTVFCLLTPFNNIISQNLTITGEQVTACEGSTVTVEVTTTNFNDIVSAQFGVTWDTDVLEYVSATGGPFPNPPIFNILNVINGELRFSWFDAVPPPGYTPPGPPLGSQVLFTLEFNVVGDYTMNNFSDIFFGDIPGFSMEIATAGGVIPNGDIDITFGSVTVADTQDPTITCPPDITVTASSGQPSAVVNFAAPVANDNCGPPTVTCNPISGSSFPVNTTTTVTCTAVDDVGNDMDCTFNVTVNPAPPNPNAVTFTAEDVDLGCNEFDFYIPITVTNFVDMFSIQFALVWDETILEYVDSVDNLNATGHPTAIYNSLNASSGEFRFSWFDSDGMAGEDLNDGDTLFLLHFNLLNASALPTNVTITDVPGFTIDIANTSGTLMPGEYMLENSTVDIQDDPPVIDNCPSNIVVNNDAGMCGAVETWPTITATDDCDNPDPIPMQEIGGASGSFFNVGKDSIAFIVTDSQGQKDTCSFTITVVDNEAPSITCPLDQTVDANASCEGTLDDYTGLVGTLSDNCSSLANITVTQTDPSGTTISTTTTVTLIATDEAGNMGTCDFDVSIVDVTDPTITCPGPQTVDADVSCEGTLGDYTGMGTPSDNCSLPANITVTQTDPSGTTINVTTTVTLTATDEAGNMGTCDFDVSIVDVTDPTITCPGPQTVDADASCEGTLGDYTGMGTPSDNCSLPANITVTQTDPSGTTISTTTTVTLIAADEAGNMGMCTFDVSIIDVTDPMITCPPNEIVAINANCEATVLDYTGMTVSLSDNCTDSMSMELTMVQTPASGTTISVETDIELKATDGVGNMASCTFKVTLDDQTDPVANCYPDTTVYLDASGMISIDPSYLNNGSSDNCPGITMSLDVNSFDCSDIGDNTVTLTVTDGSGNTDVCMTNVIVADTLAPELVQCLPDTFVIADANCQSVLPDFTALVIFDDNCTNINDLKITQIPPPGALITMDTTIAVVALDSVGIISDTCFFLVELRDTTPPTITCPVDTVLTTGLDSCNAEFTWPMPSAADNCGVDTVMCSPSSGAFFPTGSTTVTCTAIDLSGNMGSCDFMVTVNDGQAPFLDCPSDTTIFVASGVMDTMIFDIGLDSLSDNCGVDSTYYKLTGATVGDGDGDASGTSFNVDTTTVTYYAEDAAGNIDSCSFNVNIVESIIIDIDCPPNYSVVADVGECFAVVNTDAPDLDPIAGLDTVYYVLTDSTIGSGPDSVPDTQAFNVGITTVAYTAVSVTNDTSTCSFTVTVLDQENPVVTCPMTTIDLDNTTDSCGVLFDANFQLASATDNCPGVTMSYNFAVGDLIPVGDNTITATATDQANNVATCSYQVMVRDTQPPVIINCPSNIMVNNDQNLCGASVTWTPPTAEDNCGVLLLESTPYLPGDFIPVGSEFITYTASDFEGNVTECIFSVTVRDNQPPSLNPCPGNITVPNEPGLCSAVVTWPFISPGDNCNVVSFVVLPQSGSTFQIGQTNVQAVATDGSGNVTVCSFTVNVLDSEFPTMDNFPGNINVDSDPGECGAVVTWPAIIVDDNCGVDTFHCDAASGDFFPVGMHDVECTVIDVNGNAVNRIFTVTVEDNELPVVDCPEDILIFVDSSVVDDQSGFINNFQAVACDSLLLNYNSIPTMDNCGIAAVSQTSGPTSGSTVEAGMHTLTYLVTDVNGNQSACGFNITVEEIPLATAIAFPNNPCEGEDVLFSTTDYTGAIYEWRDPIGNLISGQSSFTQTGMTVAMSGTYTVTITFPFNCVQTAQVDVTVFPMPNLGIEHNDLLCASAGTDLTLEAKDTANTGIANYVWDTPGGAVFFGNPITVIAPIQGTYTVTATTGNGCSATASVLVEISTVPKTPDLTGSMTEACVGESIVLDGEEFAGPDIEYHWAASPNLTDAGLIDIDNHDNEANPVGPGIYTYYYYVTQGGCISDSAEWIVIVEGFPSFDLDSMVLGNMDCVDGTTDIVIAPMNTMAGLNWSLDVNGNCPATQVDSMFTLSNVNSDCNGLYILTATSPIGCSTSLDIDLDITDKPVAPALQITDDVICMGGSTTMFLTNVPSGANTLCFADGVPASCAFLGDPTQVPVTTTYGVLYDINGCMSDTAFVTVTVEAPLDVPIEVNGDVTCVNGTGTVTLSTSAVGDTYVWDGPCGVQAGDVLEIPNITAGCSGLYSVSVTGSLGQCISIGTLQLEVTGMIGEVTAELLSSACEGGDIELCAEPNMLGATYTWTDPFGNVFSNERCPTTAVVAAATPYSVLVEMDGCTSSDDTLVSILTSPIANDETVVGIVDAPQSFDVVANDSLATGNYTITVKQQPAHGDVSYNGEGVFTYTPDEGFRETDFMFYEICLDECPDLCSIAEVEILVRYPIDQCIATTVITPNQDGINDEFVVSCLELGGCPNNQLFIFNQWGDQVFEAAPYDNTWQGTYNDKDVPDGTYFYVFKCDNSTPAEKGFVMVHR